MYVFIIFGAFFGHSKLNLPPVCRWWPFRGPIWDPFWAHFPLTVGFVSGSVFRQPPWRAQGDVRGPLGGPNKGAKNISSALNQTAASPILYAKRDRIGPKGEGINSIATNPREVDQIARRAWKAIYDGNFENLDINAEIFMKKYDKHIFTMERPFKVEPITADEVAQACKNAKASAAAIRAAFAALSFRAPTNLHLSKRLFVTLHKIIHDSTQIRCLCVKVPTR